MKTANTVTELIGNTPLLRIPSLSRLTGCEILLKCENMNPGGSIKDRASLNMVQSAIKSGILKPGMTIVEGTAGNTGIGLAVVARAMGFKMIAVMPKGQTPEKERMLSLYGAELKLVDAVPFGNENHFYHTARRIAEQDSGNFWWANQFENPDNAAAHYNHTAPEIWQQTNGKIDVLVSVSGTGGTIGGNSKFLKEQNPNIKVLLVDPEGSGLCSFFHTGEFKMQGSSITEGIGIMRKTANFALAQIDDAITLNDQHVVSIAHFVRNEDGILLGSSSALNVAGAVHAAHQWGKGKTIVTFLCDLGERSASKLYNMEFLATKGLLVEQNQHGNLLKFDK